VAYGALRALPFSGVGTTRFAPLENSRELGGQTQRILVEVWRELSRHLARIKENTQTMLGLAASAGMSAHPLSREASGGILWRIPVLHDTEESAGQFADAAAKFGVSRLYGATLPEFAGLTPAQSRERWPNAWAFSRRLTTLPTHGRLGDGQLARLARLARDFRR